MISAVEGPSGPTVRPSKRFYWSPELRLVMIACGGVLLVVMVVVVIESLGRRHAPAWLSWLLVGLFVVAMANLVVQTALCGVRETSEGIACREFGRTKRFAWAQISAFRYGRIGWYERVLVDLVDGSSMRLPGARRFMLWQGAETASDFAALLDERRRLFLSEDQPLDRGPRTP